MTRKINDIIEFAVRINTIIPDKDLEKDVINEDDYAHEYSVSYSVNNGKEIGGYDFKTAPGFYPSEENIEEYIKDEMADVFEEVTDYEVFDVDKDIHDSQTAKVRVIAVKE